MILLFIYNKNFFNICHVEKFEIIFKEITDNLFSKLSFDMKIKLL